MSKGQLERQVSSRLAANAVRFTDGRRRVVAALAQADGPRSAAELHASLGTSIPLSSLYRSLSVMVEAGALVRHHGSRGVIRYELAEWLTGHHHHLVCADCGTVDDIELSEDLEATLEEVARRVAKSARFTVAGHTLEIDGLCKTCQ